MVQPLLGFCLFVFLMQLDIKRLTPCSFFPKLSRAGWRKSSIRDPDNGHSSDHDL